MKQPTKRIAYKKMPIWTKDTMPKAVQKQHQTKEGTWGKITILKGRLALFYLDDEGKVMSSTVFEAGDLIPFIEPQVWHRVQAQTEDVEWFLEFYCQEESYFSKKYQTSAVHSEVVEAMQWIQPCKALDLGCGQGRNALYLAQKGFNVTAVDHNQLSLELLRSLVEKEKLEMTVDSYDIAQAQLSERYDFIVSTVVLMFLEKDRISAILKNMQDQTNLGGYHLIVCAMDTEKHPDPISFPFTFKEGELAAYYNDWELIKYNEDLGHLHRRDEHGNRIQMQFVTMLAKKVKES